MSLLQATSHGNECPQIGFFGDDAGKLIGEEDCLNLNVYVPSSKELIRLRTGNMHNFKIHAFVGIFRLEKQLNFKKIRNEYFHFYDNTRG